MKLVPSLLAFTVMGSVATAHAHINLEYPPSTTMDQKSPSPCGGKGARKPTTFKPGETITLKWTETVGHPGHFRIAFDTDGMDDLKDPTSYTDIKMPAVAPILADGVHAHKTSADNVKYEFKVTLPNVACANCTLQLIQMMTDKPPFGGGNDFYYRCADIVLAGEAAAPDGGAGSDTAAGTGGMSGAGTGGAGGSSTGGAGGGTGGAGAGATGGAGAGATGGGNATGGAGGGATGGTGGSSGSTGGTGGGSSSTGGSSGSTGGRSGTGGSAPAPAPSGGEEKSGCSIAAGRSSSASIGSMGWLALVGLGLIARKRARRRV